MCALFHWDGHLASIFVPSWGLKDVVRHGEVLTEYTLKALNMTPNRISLLSTEMTPMHKAVLQNIKALDFVTAAQGGASANLMIACCVYIPH